MINLFVGCDPNGDDAESLVVLEYSVKVHSSVPVNVHFMRLGSNQLWWSDWNTVNWSTPFSGFRWTVPEACNFIGKAIYCDSDFIFLDDINKLYQQEFKDNAVVMAKGGSDQWRFCLSLWDCQRAAQYIPRAQTVKHDSFYHHKMMNFFASTPQLVQQFDGNWNCIDGENLSIQQIQALHYSDMSTQFHHKYATKRLKNAGRTHWFDGATRPHWREDLQQLFDLYYQQALDVGYKVEDYIPTELVSYTKHSEKNYHNPHRWSK
jgi:hypothetical protein